uniref:Uncharacterized protein n=1 Tax=Arundo donax TaxID=35708 RepID=A0A0A9AEN5_ARUDO
MKSCEDLQELQHKMQPTYKKGWVLRQCSFSRESLQILNNVKYLSVISEGYILKDMCFRSNIMHLFAV